MKGKVTTRKRGWRRNELDFGSSLCHFCCPLCWQLYHH